ncbi:MULTISPECIES: sensor histidine kinase [Niastella]|uniref:histidine kinase n=1 Tax=Niastella soli TaxID=2821487 RepID=A0ABS3Z107_9BACT|nr:PAS domain S-box protein [Niastella soli]MBO9203857.1 PAS domain S-box protein [Niastella soli]
MRAQPKYKKEKAPVIRSTNNPQLSPVLNSLDVGILFADREGFIFDMNNSFCRILGYERDELIGKYFLTLVPEPQHDCTLLTFTEAMGSPNPRPAEAEFPVQSKDGYIFGANCKLTVITKPDGGRYMIGSITDVTEINNYKQLLDETELAAGIGGWLLDVQLNQFSFTDGMYKLLNLPKYTIIDWEDVHSFVGKEAYLQLKQAIQKAIDKGTHFDLELDCGTLNNPKWVRAIGEPKQVFNKTIQLFGTFQNITQQKLSEQTIYLEQAKYRAIMNSGLFGYVLAIPGGPILEMNAKACEMFGYNEEEFKKIGRKGMILHTKQYLDLVDKGFRIGYVRGEQIGIKKNGEQFPSEFSAVWFKDLNGDDRISILVQDISDRKKAEGKLKKLSQIAREAVCPIVVVGIDKKIEWINPAFTRITEYTLKEVIGRALEDFLYGPETDQQVIKGFNENRKKGRIYNSEILIYTKSGHKVWFTIQAQPRFNKQGELIGYFSICIDCTERKLSEIKILHNQHILKQAEHLASLGSWEFDLKTNQTTWSDELYRIFGFRPEETMPTIENQMTIVHPDDLQYLLSSIKNTMNGSGEFDIEIRIIRPDGDTRNIRSQGHLIKNNQGDPEKLFGIIYDITEQKAAEEKLHEQESELAKVKLNQQRQIARATINAQEQERSEIGKELHDNVNQILASARLFLSTSLQENEERETFANKAAEHIHLAIEEIRKLSHALVSPSATDIGIIETINDMIKDVRATRKIDICFDHSGFHESKLDNGLKLTLYRIVQEQMSNILKYAEASHIDINIKEYRKKLTLLIIDNGKGFNPAAKRKGIGLNNIINRAEVFNGKVNIHSAPGQGCMLQVEFDK